MPASPVFVVGMPRSGTTLFSAMLDAHADISIAPETHFFTKCDVANRSPSAEAKAEAIRFLQAESGVQDMHLSAEEWQQIRDAAGDAPADILRVLLQTYAARKAARVWGEKTPDHLAHIDTIRTHFPQAVFIAITRDPRDVYLSQQPMPWNRDTIIETAWTWRRYAEQIDTYRSALGGHFHDLRYEDLLRHPEDELRKVCSFLRLPFDPGMLSFHENAEDALSAEPWKKNTRRPVDPSNTQKWKDRLPPARRWVIQRVAREQMHDYGYPTPPVAFDTDFWSDAIALIAESLRIVIRRRARKHGWR
ncbi:hypothetical protein CRI94_03290 [Longibacter salinarum]|uniref:Sulfotransferase family protein n=1 Tax=Longibacter salinarum TaxID=1850348 RepID=A0A2A8D2Y6_9BACT|nr:sulfotransferase [Longibacter salinarum]PEN15316.1 hypothetical protein CRI94_03290 [Longibacter salinarum]